MGNFTHLTLNVSCSSRIILNSSRIILNSSQLNNNVADSIPKENRPPPHNGVEAPKKCRGRPRRTVNYANVVGLNHNPGISLDWTVQEQLALQKELAKFALPCCGITLYAKIAKKIPTKTIRDIALRLKWMNENVTDLPIQSPDSADLPIQSPDSADLPIQSPDSADLPIQSPDSADPPIQLPDSADQPNILSTHPPEDVRMDNDDGISFDDIGVLSETTQQALDLIEANLASLDDPNLIYDNVDLYLQIENNFNEVLNE